MLKYSKGVARELAFRSIAMIVLTSNICVERLVKHRIVFHLCMHLDLLDLCGCNQLVLDALSKIVIVAARDGFLPEVAGQIHKYGDIKMVELLDDKAGRILGRYYPANDMG